LQVIATAGHVDHGKSTLVRALTGMEPDRSAEERRRGMTIDLGYAWTRLPSGQQIAFVDVPGHERFATNMLAGVGPAPAVLLVVAADEGWAMQTDEHVRALDALRVRHGILAVTRTDLADPTEAITQARAHLAVTTLADIPAVGVSGKTGDGIDHLRTALGELVDKLPRGDHNARIRLWVDRSFTIRGSGTVVTGTLVAGTVHQGDILDLAGEAVTVRGLQRLGEATTEVRAPARIAINLRNLPRDKVRRGDALLTPRSWRPTRVVDMRLDCREIATQLVLHIGSAAVAAQVRRLGAIGERDEFSIVRVTLERPLPLEVGDRVLLRDPGRRHILGGATVLDPAPPALSRRGSAAAREASLHDDLGAPDLGLELTRRHAINADTLRALGVDIPSQLPPGTVVAGKWLIAETQWERWRSELRTALESPSDRALVDVGVRHADLVRSLRLPDSDLLDALVVGCPDLESVGDWVRQRGRKTSLRPDIEVAISRLTERLRAHPFAAPDQPQLVALGLGRRELGAAVAAGVLLQLPGGVVLLPSAPQEAAARLAALADLFTLSTARQALATTRRVAVPLLEHLDRIGITERMDGELRRLRKRAVVPDWTA